MRFFLLPDIPAGNVSLDNGWEVDHWGWSLFIVPITNIVIVVTVVAGVHVIEAITFLRCVGTISQMPLSDVCCLIAVIWKNLWKHGLIEQSVLIANHSVLVSVASGKELCPGRANIMDMKIWPGLRSFLLDPTERYLEFWRLGYRLLRCRYIEVDQQRQRRCLACSYEILILEFVSIKCSSVLQIVYETYINSLLKSSFQCVSSKIQLVLYSM